MPAKPPGTSRARSAQRSSSVRKAAHSRRTESRRVAGSSTMCASAGQDCPRCAQRGGSEGCAHPRPRSARLTTLFLQDVAAEILVIHDLAEPVAHLVGVELDAL